MSAEPTPKSPVVLKAVNKPTEEIGAPGLKEYGGFLQEEFVVDLRGPRGAQRYKEMVDNCPAVDAALSTMKNTAQRSIQDGRVEPFDDENAKAEDQERAEFVEQCFEDMGHSRADMDDEAFTMFEMGYAPLEIVYKRRNGFKRDEERSSRFDDEAVGWGKVRLRAQESVLRWDFDEMGRRLLGMVQIPAPSYRELSIPIERIALFRTTSVKGNPEGRSLLRAAYFAYKFFKRGTAMGWVGAERDVTGIPVLKGPSTLFSATPNTDQAAGLARLKQIGENVRNDEQACVLIPSDVDPDTKVPLYSFDLVSSPGTKVMDVPAMTRDQERQILMVLFSDFLLMGHEKIGTQAMFGGRMSLYAMQLDSLLDRYDETINRQMIPRLAMLNGWPMDRLPRFKHGRVTETALEELGKFLQSYATAGGVLDPDLDAYVREQAGWPQASPEAVEMLMAPPAPVMPPGATTETEDEPEEVEDEPDEEDEKPKVKKYSPGQPRDDAGRFGEGGGSGASGGGDTSTGAGAWSDADGNAASSTSLAGDKTRAQYEQVRVGLVGTKGSAQRVSPKEAQALQDYADVAHQKVNGALRAGKGENLAITKSMDSMFSKADPLPSDVTVYRGLSKGASSRLATIEPGATFVDKGYVSTSFSASEAGQFAIKGGGGVIRIRVPKGSRALPGVRLEREAILPRNTKFRVVSRDTHGITVEVVR